MTQRPRHHNPLALALRVFVAAVFPALGIVGYAQTNSQITPAPQQLAFAGLNSLAAAGKINGVQADSSGNLYLLVDDNDGIRILKTDNAASALLAQIHLGTTGDSGVALALDPAGDVFITGTTSSTTLSATANAAIPARTGTATNSFVAGLDSSLNLKFLSFTGGSRIAASAIAASGDAIFVTGITFAADLPVTASAIQQVPAYASSESGFVERFNSAGTYIVYATYLTGANGSTQPAAIAVDSADDAWIAGSTSATGFPTLGALVPEMLGSASGFLTRLTPAGDGIVASTFIPGTGLTALTLDSTGSVLLATGNVDPAQFPVDTVAGPLAPVAYQTLLRLPLTLDSVLSGTLLVPAAQSTVAAGPNGSAWITGTLTEPLLPLPAIASLGKGFLAQVTNTGGTTAPYQITRIIRAGGLPNAAPAYASLPLSLTALAVDPAGEAIFGGSIAPTASSSLLATETYDLPLLPGPTATLPSQLRQAKTTASACNGSLCAGSAAYLAKLNPAAGISLAFSTDDSPRIVLRNLGSSTAASLTLSVSTGSFTTSCGSSLTPGSECDLLLTGGGAGTVTATTGTGTQTAPFPAFTTPADSLVFSPKELDFGLVTSGSTTPTAILTVSNLGSAVQTFSSAPDVGLKATSPFSQASSDCPTSGVATTKQLAAGAICHITLTFTPYAAASNDGPVTGLWSIGSHDVELTAHSQAAALSVSSSTVEFGTQFAGGLRLPRYLYLSNASSTPSPHSALALPASSPFTITDRCPAELLPNTVCQIRIDYSAATAPSSDSAVLSLDAGLSVALAGKTLPQPGVTGASVNPSLAVSPLAITFADPVVVTSTSSTTATVGITNSGASAFSLSLALSGDFSDSTSCGATLAAGATCAVAITFAPSQPGTRGGLLAITAGAGTSPLYVTLSGIGTALLAAGNSAIDLGSTLVGEPVTQFLKLSQPFTSLAITATSPFSAVLVEDTGFGYGNPPAASFASSLTGACHTCFLGIRFLPTTAGSQSGTLTLASSQLGATQTVALTGTATPTSGLLLSPSVQNFGNIPLHSSSGTSLFTLTNLLANQASASLGSPSVSGDFSLAAAASPAPCPVTLPFGASCTLAVAFAPSTTGTRGGMLTIAAATAQLSGLGTADPGIAISPLALTFANTAGSSATTQSVTLTNTGTATLQVGTPTSANAAFQTSSACGSLAAPASCTVTVIYTPGDLLTTGALTIPVTSAGQTIAYTVALNGTYANTSAGLAISPAQAVFAPTPTNTIGTTQQITLTNLTTKTFALQVDLPRQFPLAGAPCTALGPGQSCTFAITFVPLTFGPVAGSIVVQAIPTDGSATRTTIAYAEGYGSGSGTVSLTGGLIVNNVYNFGQVTSGQSASQTFTVNNAGSAGSPTIHIRRVVSQPPFLATTTCGAPLNPGQTCTITVNYTARNSGQATIPDTGLLTIESDAASSPNLLNLTGVAGVASGSAGSAPLAAYTLSTSALTFPTTSVGDLSPTQTVTLTNTGSINLHILALATPADFTAQTTCGTVIPGATCTFSITSTPQTAGPLLGALAIASDSANSLEFLSLLGTGQPSALVITPASLSFAPLLIGATSVLPLQIANSGASPVTLSPLTVSGDFSAAGPCVILAAASGNLAAGATCSAEVTFKPTAAGTRGGTLSVTSTASALPLQVSLTGTGLQAFLTATPATVAFPGTVIGTTQTLQLTLSNTGLSAIASIALTASGDYTIASPCPMTLAGGASCTVQIAFTPSAAGPRPSTLAVTSSDPGSPLTVPLSGTGLPAPTFTIMVNGGATASATVTSGQPATFPVILTPQNGFTGPVALTCGAIAAAQYASCSINPALPSLTAGAQSATVTINTITAANGSARLQVPAGTSLTRTLLCSMFPGLIALWRRRKSLRRRLPVLLAMLCTTISLFVAGCGGGSNGYPASLYTPPGTYQLKVTGSSTSGPAISQSVTLNLTVTAN